MTEHSEGPVAGSALEIEVPMTGDDGVDFVLTDFARAVSSPGAAEQSNDLAAQVEAATQAHRRLQERLSAPRA
ncbi:MAG: hypothetical protein WA880_13595 [Ornithinimicrobium sp.]